MTEDEYDMADEVEFWTGLGERLNDAVRAMVAPWSEVEAMARECGCEARFGDGGGA